ncbi:MAG: hypothetical protein KBA66_10440 [Leptospiraceae bacterium]|nr:hypothetical protein [Leptospiraceae bacterium]
MLNKKIIVLFVFLSVLLTSSSLFADACTLVGHFTQGAKSSDFSWSVNVSRNGESFSLSGTTADEYGSAKVAGTCDANHVCQFSKTYTSGASKGSTFFYAGKASDEGIKGKWGFKKGDFSGGNFDAQVLDCH